MKTLTEFDPFRVNKVLQLLTDLGAQGKSPEEQEQAVGEAMKMEGDKLKLIIKSAEHVKDKTEGLRRVVVFLGNEGEAAPPKTIKVENHFLLIEYFQAPRKASDEPSEKGHGRGGRGKGRGQDRGGRRDNERGGRGQGSGKGDGRGNKDNRDKPVAGAAPQVMAKESGGGSPTKG